MVTATEKKVMVIDADGGMHGDPDPVPFVSTYLP